uniref:Uncharacterized protein n=1 Tax=Timema monikensis TaxID=170555 RepID=A0A7R9ED77_9NEOP|nr:unnamed protein product [Timema monikensis]
METVAISSFSDPPCLSSHEEVRGLLANQASVDSPIEDTLVVSPLRDGCCSRRNATTSWATSLRRATACSNIHCLRGPLPLSQLTSEALESYRLLPGRGLVEASLVRLYNKIYANTWCSVTGESECGHVFLTLSSLWHLSTHDRGLVDREIELNWETTGCEEELPPEWVELFNTDPHTNTHSDRPVPLLRVKPSDYPDGFYKTNLSLGRPPYPGGWSKDEGAGVKEEGSHCFPYWIASFRNSILLHSDCLKIRPTWMGDNRQQLGSVPLVSLFIPGTHNSGSHQRGATLTRRDTLAGYLLTQDTDVWGQLVHGIRYLDLRVGYYPPSANKTRNQNHSGLVYRECSTLDHVNTEAESTWLWPPLKQLWGDEQTVDGLQEYLSRAMDAGVTGLWAAMAELTPTPLDIMFKPSGSLRHMADSVNRNITAWFRHRWWQHANIVATDYFLGNGIIDVAWTNPNTGGPSTDETGPLSKQVQISGAQRPVDDARVGQIGHFQVHASKERCRGKHDLPVSEPNPSLVSPQDRVKPMISTENLTRKHEHE